MEAFWQGSFFSLGSFFSVPDRFRCVSLVFVGVLTHIVLMCDDVGGNKNKVGGIREAFRYINLLTIRMAHQQTDEINDSWNTHPPVPLSLAWATPC